VRPARADLITVVVLGHAPRRPARPAPGSENPKPSTRSWCSGSRREQGPLLGTRLKIHYGASIYWKSDDGATFATHGRIGAHFESLGGSGGVLGFPLSEEKEVRSGPGTGGRYQEFEGGRIYFGYVDGARAIEVVGDLGALHQALDGAEGRFGFPTAPATTVPNLPTASVQEFEGGTLAAMSPADSS
jgi:uncharacterized protein with LGFP repeats